MRRDTRKLKSKAIDSIVLAIELFNRPDERGRSTAVLISADHAFEMLLKAIIHQRGGVIRKRRDANTIGFKECVQLCRHEPSIRCLGSEQEVTLRALNGWRDAAQHYLIDLSEQQLYMAIQGAATLFDELMASVFGESLATHVPGRVLPVSTDPPKDLALLLDDELGFIRDLVAPGSRRSGDARARLRAIAILEQAAARSDEPPTDEALDKQLSDLMAGRDWRHVFPGVAGLDLTTSGSGLTFSLRLSKKEGLPVRIVPADSPEAEGAPVVVKRVDELGWYCFGYRDLIERHNLTFNKGHAVLDQLGITSDEKYMKVFTIGKSTHKRYSQAADQLLKERLPTLDVDAIWAQRRRSRP